MKCFNCGYPFHTEKLNQCPMCHVKIGNFCDICKNPNPVLASFCGNCGHEINANIMNVDDQRKKMVIMFADVSGFTKLSETMDHERVKTIMDNTFKALTKAIFKHGGEIDKFIGDCIMVTFGRTMTHINDVPNSIACASDMHKIMHDLSFEDDLTLELSIGINFGEVTLGYVGSTFDSDYTAMGDVVNTAQRIQSSASAGETLVAHSVFNLTKDIYSYSKPTNVTVKNKSVPLRVYRPLKRIESSLKYPLFNREEEIITIKSIMDKGYVPYIIADAGMGKTALVEKYIQNHVDCKSYWFTCEQQYRNRAYYAINHWIEQMHTSVESIIDSLYRRKTPEEVYKHALLSLNVKGDYKIDSDLKQLKPTDIVNLTQEAYLDLIHSFILDEAFILVIDDLQWCDYESKRIIGRLSKEPWCQLLIISRETFEIEGTKEITLKPLNLDGIRMMIDWYSYSNVLNDIDVQTLHSKSHGNPLIVMELIRHINDKGTIDTSAIPDTMERLIIENLTTLDEQVYHFLKKACVLGKAFNIYDYKEYFKTTIDSIQLLNQLDWIAIEDKSKDQLTFSFLSDTHKKVIYESLPNDLKITSHKQLYELSKDLERKLYHISYVDNRDKLVDTALKLGRQYYKECLYSQSKDRYHLALKHGCEESVISDELLDLYDKLNASDSALELIERLNVQVMDYSKRLSLIKEKAGWYVKIGSLKAALETVNTLMEMASRHSVFFGYAEMYMGNITRMKGKTEAANHLKTAYELLNFTNDYDALSEIKRQMGILYIIQGYQNNAQKSLEEAHAYASKTGNLNQISRINNNLAMVYFANGIFVKAEETYLASIDNAKKVLDQRLEIMARINLGIAYMKYGFLDKSDKQLQLALTLADNSNMQYHSINAQVNSFELSVLKGHVDAEGLNKFKSKLISLDLPIEYAILNLFSQFLDNRNETSFIDIFLNANEFEVLIDAMDMCYFFIDHFTIPNSLDIDAISSVESKLEQVKLKRIEALHLNSKAMLDEALDLAKLIGNTLEITKCYLFGLKFGLYVKEDLSQFVTLQLHNSEQTVFHDMLLQLLK